MKSEYEMPSISLIRFSSINIIRTSDGEPWGDIGTGNSGSGGNVPMPTGEF